MKLVLIPTPIDESSPLEPVAFKLLSSHALDDMSLIIVEDLKPARRRWVRFGLDRNAIDKFIAYNEHSFKEKALEVLKQLKAGKSAYMMSDCGIPAFCDPGRLLVDLCHQHNIPVTSTPFANSIALAVALSGFDHSRFIFEGFLSNKKECRTQDVKRVAKQKEVSVLMDTPYRLSRLLSELAQHAPNRRATLCLELNSSEEKVKQSSLAKLATEFKDVKAQFVLVMDKL